PSGTPSVAWSETFFRFTRMGWLWTGPFVAVLITAPHGACHPVPETPSRNRFFAGSYTFQGHVHAPPLTFCMWRADLQSSFITPQRHPECWKGLELEVLP